MKRIVRNTLATVTGVVAVSTLAAVPAEAQTISGGSCGAGYHQQDAYPLGNSQGATGAGVIFLDSTAPPARTARSCAVTPTSSSPTACPSA
ncbi:hypothetical protein OHB36_09635 [Streptomyces sp. NBC_00320]|uniref:hypothetical protein n=1 Tax=unclassified Streptomyces TaxID=2593676 RepID=UPI00224D23D4|nr:hypothetical protein [Streptomyces sp. NBC_00320]MCX5147030.1 hypothetical protein [Streptomyces sp. NBC_00320]